MRIPFFVSPYPDEILGSWLFRLQTHNHPSSIDSLVEQYVFRKIDEMGWRDIFLPSVEADQILGALGTTYGKVMMELTTYPYWLRFHSERTLSAEISCCVKEIPKLILRNRREVGRRITYLRPNVLKICPICLDEDFYKYGEPYLHRAHHLPFVRVCHKHGLELATRCPNCEQLFHRGSTYMQARILCSCGYDLRLIRAEVKSTKVSWGRLAVYSAQALWSRDDFEKCSDVYSFFDSRLTEEGILNRPELLDHLTSSYGATGAKAILTISPQRTEDFTHAHIGSTSKQEFRAPQICALLATIESDFKETNVKLGQFLKLNEVRAGDSIIQEKKLHRIPQSIDEARYYVLQIQEEVGERVTRSVIYRRYKTLFWYLTIYDQAWFEGKYPHGKRGATANLPSVETDRRSILQAILRANDRGVRVWKNFAQQACFRASIRDLEWFESQKEETARRIKEVSVQRKLRLRTIHVEDFKQSYKRARNTKGSGVKISFKDIAAYASLNVTQLKNLLYSTPELQVLMNASQDSDE